MSEIWRERHELDKARREFMREAMAEYDKTHYEKMRALQARCEHNWKFTDFGPLGDPWYSCSFCGKTCAAAQPPTPPSEGEPK